MNFTVVIKKMKPKSEKEKSGVFRTPLKCKVFNEKKLKLTIFSIKIKSLED